MAMTTGMRTAAVQTKTPSTASPRLRQTASLDVLNAFRCAYGMAAARTMSAAPAPASSTPVTSPASKPRVRTSMTCIMPLVNASTPSVRTATARSPGRIRGTRTLTATTMTTVRSSCAHVRPRDAPSRSIRASSTAWMRITTLASWTIRVSHLDAAVEITSDECPLLVLRFGGRLQPPLELELDLLLVRVALVLDGELRSFGDSDPLAGDLDPERCLFLEGVGEAPELGDHVLGRVHALDVPMLFGHGGVVLRFVGARSATSSSSGSPCRASPWAGGPGGTGSGSTGSTGIAFSGSGGAAGPVPPRPRWSTWARRRRRTAAGR